MNTNIDKLLEGMKCECGAVHTCDIEKVIIRSGAIAELRDLTENYRSVLVVADSNTYKTCGDRVVELLDKKTEKLLVYEGDGILVPNEDAIEKMKKCVSENTDLIIGIGSGVIQDLCKYVSFVMKLPYFIVATAPSMDGYASKGAALIIGNMKVTYDAHVPAVIIGDTDILKDAPLRSVLNMEKVWKKRKTLDFLYDTALLRDNGGKQSEKVYNALMEIIMEKKGADIEKDEDGKYIAASSLAYDDMRTSRPTLSKGKNKEEKNMELKTKVSIYLCSEIKGKLETFRDSKEDLQKEYDKWHEHLCKYIITFYKKNKITLTYGHAQKWVNMMMKYLYAFGVDISPVLPYLHIPIDSYIYDAVKKAFGYPKNFRDIFGEMGNNFSWSKIDNYEQYSKYQKEVRERLRNQSLFDWEFNAWMTEKIKRS